jgi:hypothetical protein
VGVYGGSRRIGNASGPDHGLITVSVYYDKVAISGDFQLCLVDAGADDGCLPIGNPYSVEDWDLVEPYA